jgi:hypothetical protein
MVENLSVVAAGFFKGLGQLGHPVEGPLLVHGCVALQ